MDIINRIKFKYMNSFKPVNSEVFSPHSPDNSSSLILMAVAICTQWIVLLRKIICVFKANVKQPPQKFRWSDYCIAYSSCCQATLTFLQVQFNCRLQGSHSYLLNSNA